MFPWGKNGTCPAWDEKNNKCTLDRSEYSAYAAYELDTPINAALFIPDKSYCSNREKSMYCPRLREFAHACEYVFMRKQKDMIEKGLAPRIRGDHYYKENGILFPEGCSEDMPFACPYMMWEPITLFGTNKYYCCSTGEKREINSYQQFSWYCDLSVVSASYPFDRVNFSTLDGSRGREYPRNSFFPDCPYYLSATAPVNIVRVLREKATAEELALKDEEKRRREKERQEQREKRAAELKKKTEKTLDYAEKEKERAEKKAQGSGNQQNQKTGCFITSATLLTLKGTDDCYELTKFREFRDTFLMLEPDGRDLIQEYYAIAPKIVEKIDSLTDATKIYQGIYNEYLKKCLDFIECNQMVACKQLYVSMVMDLSNKYLLKEM